MCAAAATPSGQQITEVEFFNDVDPLPMSVPAEWEADWVSEDVSDDVEDEELRITARLPVIMPGRAS